jgi:hypothetical protein
MKRAGVEPCLLRQRDPQRGFLGGTGWVDTFGSAWLPTVVAGQGRWFTCARDVCCSFLEGVTSCWGHRPSAPDEYTVLPDDARVHGALFLVPRPDGHVYGCVPVRDQSAYLCLDVTAARDGESVAFSTMVSMPYWWAGSEPYRQAICAPRRSDWWQCWGTHDGWGHE